MRVEASRNREASAESEEGRLVVTLEMDVEAQGPGLGASYQRGASARIRDHRKNGVGGVCRVLVGKVDSSHEAVEQTSREHRDVKMGRFDGDALCETSARLHDEEVKLALGIGGAATKAGPVGCPTPR